MNINDFERLYGGSFASEIKRGQTVLSEVEKIKQACGLSARVPDELRRAKEAIANVIRPTYIADRVKESENLISRLGQLDSIVARRTAMFDNANKAIARHNEMFGNAAASIEARRNGLNEVLGLGISREKDVIREMVSRAKESFGGFDARQQIEDFRRDQAERAAIRTTFTQTPQPRFELPHLAEQRIKAIEKEEKEKRENLPFGKSLEMSVIAGGMQFRVQGYEAFSAKDRLMIEIRTIGGDVTLNVPHDQIIILYKEVGIIDKNTDTIH